jgi:hypothetical protein
MAAPIRRSMVRLLEFAVLLACSTGCTVVGYTVGRVADEGRRGTPVALEQATEIERGTPLRVDLFDGGNVRGFFLGMLTLDSTGVPGRRSALRLGVGNRELIDRMCAKGHVLEQATTADVPDTLVFPLNRVRGLSVYEPGRAAAGGAASGAAIDVTVVLVVLAIVGVGALALIGITR